MNKQFVTKTNSEIAVVKVIRFLNSTLFRGVTFSFEFVDEAAGRYKIYALGNVSSDIIHNIRLTADGFISGFDCALE